MKKNAKGMLCGALAAMMLLAGCAPQTQEESAVDAQEDSAASHSSYLDRQLSTGETQAVLPLFDGDLAEVMYACATGALRPDMVKWKSGAAVCVVMASGGYPGSYPKGIAITGLEEASKLEDVVVFHAGTKEVDGQIVTNGGRVLGVTAVDETIAKAKERAYGAVERIHFEGAQYRKDIAWRALNR